MKIKGSNGVVFDVAESVAHGLIDGGHAVAADGSTSDLAPSLGDNQGAVYRHAVAPDGVQPIHTDQRTVTEDVAGAKERNAGVASPTQPAGDAATGEDDEPKVAAPEQPAGNATLDAWRDYALAIGVDKAQIEGLKRDEVRDFAQAYAKSE